ncbi:MAG TPA: phenylalanine--tRNA ligase subunit beta [Dictyobacter sp.]|jgi:phenylalanyl-tRNA synthetase beta chain|nr:phenylalanine--tRNA ligase subunit beta [Dictyobacter sp.]
MRVPLSWLKEYVDITMSPEELAHTLTMAGLEVEAIEYIGQSWGEKIITAQIVHLEKVEGSDHLNYTHIDTGSGQLNVVCGAPNIQLGDKVPLALPGAQIGDLTIGETKKFGYVSQGMLCSPRELGLGNDHSGIYLLEQDVELGQPLVNLLGEVVLDFAIKAHRGDLSSIVGVAREVAALTKQPLRIPQPEFQEQGTAVTEMVKVTVEDAELCPRYSARVISNIKIGPSPSWMGLRLLAAGMRPINNIVDITNYVMLELGQPLHGFDYDKVPEHHIIVRHAHENETLTTLDDVKRRLNPSMLLITDPTGPTAVAGVMGGAKSEVSDQTTSVLLESANFKANSVRRTSTTLNLRTDASGRYEKGVDPELTLLAASRAAQLMVEFAGGVVHPGVVDVYPQPVQIHQLEFSIDDVEWLTSMKLSQQEVADALIALNFSVELRSDEKTMLVTVPTYRADIDEEADLVEEVIRLIGYDRIPSTIPVGPLPEVNLSKWFNREQEIRSLLVGAGLNEIVTYTLTSRARMLQLLPRADEESAHALTWEINRSLAQEEANLARATSVADGEYDPKTLPALSLVNPLSSDLDTLRLTLLSNVMEILQENSKRSRDGLRFFEIGRRYLPVHGTKQAPDERRTVAIGLGGPAAISWLPELSKPADFYDLKGLVETLLAGLKITHYRFTATQHPTFHPGRSALLELGVVSPAGEVAYSPAGVLGEVHPLVQQRYDLPYRTYLSEIDLELLYAAVPQEIRYQPISRHQELSRDLALVVDEKISAQIIHDNIVRHGGELLKSVTLFDVYTGDPIPAGKKNLTYSLIYQAQDRTLKDAEANALQEHIIKVLNEDFKAVLR